MGPPRKDIPSDPLPEFEPYLQRFGISWGDFTKRMTRDPEIKRIRSEVVTLLHSQGTHWGEITRLTTFGAGQIHGLAKSIGCDAAKANQRAAGAKSGALGKGRKKPEFSERLKSDWAAGKYDFFRGRNRPEEEVLRLREVWANPAWKEAKSKARVALWKSPHYRKKLEGIHRSPRNRSLYSRMQCERLQKEPEKWGWGKGAYVLGEKHTGGNPFWVRSSYEVAAVLLLEGDPKVLRYEYEPRFLCADGKSCLPDFRVWVSDGCSKIVEVKASWVLKLPPEHPRSKGLERQRDVACREGLDFEIWTEEGKLYGKV